MIKNARVELVHRLDTYAQKHPDTFKKVVSVLEAEFFKIIRRQVCFLGPFPRWFSLHFVQALAGRAIIRSTNTVFLDPTALDIALDAARKGACSFVRVSFLVSFLPHPAKQIRGFVVVLDYQRALCPKAWTPNRDIKVSEHKVFQFEIEFPKPTIRRGY